MSSTAIDTDSMSGGRDWADEMLQRKWPVSLAFAATIVALWQLLGTLGELPGYIVSPASIVSGIWDLAETGELWDLLIPSLKRSFTGFAIGASLGVLVGLLAGTVPAITDLLELPVSFTYPLPKIALFPAFAVILGFSDTTRIIVIALACFYPAYLNAAAGTRSIDPNYIEFARNVEASRTRTFFQVIFPAALPSVFTGLRICLAISFILLFSTEIIGFSNGIGSDILKSSREGLYQRMYAGIAVLAIVGFVSSRVLLYIGKVATHGRLSGGVPNE